MGSSIGLFLVVSSFPGLAGIMGCFEGWGSSVDDVDPGELSWGTNGVYFEESSAGAFDGGVESSSLPLG